MWINREISDLLIETSSAIQIVLGPRQCGKSSLLLHLGPDFEEISLDDPNLRALAQSEPENLLEQFSDRKIFIDEVQYAPELFPVLKRRADLYRRRNQSGTEQTIIRLSGSNLILLDRYVKESLAGRAAFFEMNTLSVSEILASSDKPIQEILFMGGWPYLHAHPNYDVRRYLDDYINSYVERDIVLSAGIQKQREFLLFIKLLAGRVGQIVDYSNLGKDVGIDAKTAKDWLSILERMKIVALVQPYSSNLSSRLSKSPKVYFLDTGLACRLQGWSSSEPIFTSPQQGPLFENLVFCELYKANINKSLGWEIFHWRSRAGEEVDFMINTKPNQFFFLEAKTSFQKRYDLSAFPEVRKVFKKEIPPIFNCIMTGDRVLDGNIPIRFLNREIHNLSGSMSSAE